MKCSILHCKNQVKFKFPSNVRVKKKWLEAIRRPTFVPSLKHGLCTDHFHSTDIITESYRAGYKLERVHLKRGTVPTIFPWQKEVNENIQTHALNGCLEKLNTLAEAKQPKNYKADTNSDEYSKLNLSKISNDNCIDNSDTQSHLEFCSDIVVSTVNTKSDHAYSKIVHKEEVTSDFIYMEMNSESNSSRNIQHQQYSGKETKPTVLSQTISTPRYNIDDFKNKPKSLLHFTGLENYEKFMKVLYSLGPAVYNLKYERSSVGDLSIPNQLFLVLWKLRRYPNDIELAEHFNVPIIAVGNIFMTWIKFMAKIWSLIDLWPSQELINFFTPETFKKNYPSTREIVDGTEIKTEASSNSGQKQSSFSSYQNTTNVKTLIGGSPGGLIIHFSPTDGKKKCQSRNTIMSDKGFMVQDRFSPHNMTIATPSPLVSGSLPHKIVIKDRNLSKHIERMHIERLIGLLKTFTILSKKLNHYYLPLISDIIGVCVMLTNFKENIMKDI